MANNFVSDRHPDCPAALVEATTSRHEGVKRSCRFAMGRGERARGFNRACRVCVYRPSCSVDERRGSLRESVEVGR